MTGELADRFCARNPDARHLFTLQRDLSDSGMNLIKANCLLKLMMPRMVGAAKGFFPTELISRRCAPSFK